MKIILVIIFAFLKTGASLKCIQCSGRDEAECQAKEIIQDCSQHIKNPVCVTLTYAEKLNEEKTIHTMIKKCSEETGCGNRHCARFWIDCKTFCCKNDMCNYRKAKKPEVNQKTKRGITDDSSSASIRITNVTFFIVVTLLTMQLL